MSAPAQTARPWWRLGAAVALNLPRLARRAGPWREETRASATTTR